MQFKPIHLGRFVAALLNQKGLSHAWLASQLGISTNSARRMLRQESFRIATLREFSGLLGSDLFLQLVSPESSAAFAAEMDARVADVRAALQSEADAVRREASKNAEKMEAEVLRMQQAAEAERLKRMALEAEREALQAKIVALEQSREIMKRELEVQAGQLNFLRDLLRDRQDRQAG